MEKWASKAPGPSNARNQQWTATRCHRLLRPLLTHVAALRKEVGWQRSFCHGHDVAHSRARDNADEANGKRPSSECDPFPARKRARYTYSLRASKTAIHRDSARNCQANKTKGSRGRQEEPSKEGMVLPTPVVKRARGCPMSSPVPNPRPLHDIAASRGGRCHHAQECCSSRCILELELAALRKTTIPSRFSLYESVFRALDALLRATSAQRPKPSAAKSLLAMCLRKVPDYVAELEFWKQEDAEANGTRSALDGSGISFEIYSELESLGTGNGGWKHLSDVTRAHGIRVVKTAISEGLIDLEFSALLARLCNESPSFADREVLVEAIVSRRYAKPSGTDDWFARSSKTMPLEILIPSPSKMWTAPFRAKTMLNLLNRQLLPREWILTRDFGTIWSWTVRDLVRKDMAPDTMTFIITSIRALCDHMLSRGRKSSSSDEGLTIAQQTLISALTALVTTSLLGQQTLAEDPTIPSRGRIRTINRRVDYIIRSCLAGTTSSRNRGTRPSTYLLLLATFFLDPAPESPETDQPRVGSGGSTTTTKELEYCWSEDDSGPGSCRRKQQCEATLALMCSIAQCCGRGTTAPANTYLTKLCDRLEMTRNRPQNMRQDAAFLLADQTGDLRDLAFAEGLEAQPDAAVAGLAAAEAAAGAVNGSRRTPRRRTAFAGFRWDEGISEWVTASPVLAPRRRAEAVTATTTRRAASSAGSLEMTSRDVTPRPRAEDAAPRQISDISPASGAEEDIQIPGIETWIAGTSCSPEGLATEQEKGNDRAPRYNQPRPKRKSTGGRPLAEAEVADDSIESLDSDADELWADRQGREARRSGGRKAVEWHVPTKRRRAGGSLQSRQPLKPIPGAYFDYDGSSDDELCL